MTTGEVRVRLFAGLREEAGWQERSLVHQSGMTATSVWTLLNLGGAAPPASVRVAINHEFATLDTQLSTGDELAFLPPISGG